MSTSSSSRSSRGERREGSGRLKQRQRRRKSAVVRLLLQLLRAGPLRGAACGEGAAPLRRTNGRGGRCSCCPRGIPSSSSSHRWRRCAARFRSGGQRLLGYNERFVRDGSGRNRREARRWGEGSGRADGNENERTAFCTTFAANVALMPRHTSDAFRRSRLAPADLSGLCPRG